jgi:hypothetical protein
MAVEALPDLPHAVRGLAVEEGGECGAVKVVAGGHVRKAKGPGSVTHAA